MVNKLQSPEETRSQASRRQAETESIAVDGWWTVQLTAQHDVGEGAEVYTVYEIEVSFQDKQTGRSRVWFCSRRYSDFENFHRRVGLPLLGASFLGEKPSLASGIFTHRDCS